MLKCYLQLEKYGGQKNWKSRKLVSRSFVKAFLNGLYNTSAAAGHTTLNTLGNSVIQSGNSSGYQKMFFINVGGGGGQALSDNAENFFSQPPCEQIGIVVGTGNTAVTPTDIGLATLIAHGVSSTKLEYFGHNISEVTVSAPNAFFNIERIFRNSSGAGITVNEIGIYTNISAASDSFDLSTKLFCYIRDVLGSPVTVNNGEYLKVQYQIQITT